jgi:hypothetical protein
MWNGKTINVFERRMTILIQRSYYHYSYSYSYYYFVINSSRAHFGPWPLFSVYWNYTVDRNPWVGDEPVARPLPTHRAHRINAHRHPCLTWDSNLRPQVFRGRNSLYNRPLGHCDRHSGYHEHQYLAKSASKNYHLLPIYASVPGDLCPGIIRTKTTYVYFLHWYCMFHQPSSPVKKINLKASHHTILSNISLFAV